MSPMAASVNRVINFSVPEKLEGNFLSGQVALTFQLPMKKVTHPYVINFICIAEGGKRF
jgi:hypothetical protein